MISRRAKFLAIVGAAALTATAGGFSLVQAANDSGNTLTAISPCRLVDTRAATNVGPRLGALGAEETVTFTAIGNSGECTNIAADTQVIEIQLTSVGTTANTFWTAYPSDQATRPSASQLNPRASLSTTSNSTIVTLSDDGKFNLYNHSGSSDVVIDILGAYSPSETNQPGTVGPMGATGPQGPPGPAGGGNSGPSEAERVEGIESDNDMLPKDSTAECPTGKTLVGGGYVIMIGSGDPDTFPFPAVYENAPLNNTEWRVATGPSASEFIIQSYALCTGDINP